MKYLINHLVINSDQIVMAEYTPADSGIDSETGEPFSRRSRCEITLTSTHVETEMAYEDRVIGTASKSDEIILHGAEAERFWDAYIGDAYTVVAPKLDKVQ